MASSSLLSIESIIVYLNNIAITLLHRNQYYDSIQTFKNVIGLVKQRNKDQQNEITCITTYTIEQPAKTSSKSNDVTERQP